MYYCVQNSILVIHPSDKSGGKANLPPTAQNYFAEDNMKEQQQQYILNLFQRSFFPKHYVLDQKLTRAYPNR